MVLDQKTLLLILLINILINVNKPRIAFIDLDGTLLNVFGKVTSQSVKAISLLKNNNIIPIIATGRHDEGINHIASKLNVEYYIANNGAYVYDVNKKEKIFKSTITAKKIKEFLLKMDKEKMFFLVYTDGGVFRNSDRYKVLTNKFLTIYKMKNWKELDLDSDLEIYKLYVIRKMGPIRSKRDIKYFSEYLTNLYIHKTFSSGWTIVSKNTDKSTGAEFLLNKFNLTWKEAAAFGDGMNDYEMIRKANYGIAMGSGWSELHKIAWHTSRKNDYNRFSNSVKYLINNY